MRSALLAAASFACLSACSTFRSNTAVTSSLSLVDGGRAVAQIRTGGIERIHMRLENKGPGTVVFEARDEFDHVLDQGELGRGERMFEWRPLKYSITLTLTGRGATNVDYRVSSESGVSIEWNLTHAQKAPAK